MKSLMSPSELARAVGVSESSLKRWVDEGRINASRTAGGHRRIPIAEAIRLIRETGLPVRHPELLGIPELAESESDPARIHADAPTQLEDALRAGNAGQARGLILAAYLDGRPVAEICDDLVSVAMRQIGHLWTTGPEGIYIEHRATDLCTQALQSLRTLIPRPDPPGPTAIGGAPGGDQHTLASLMAASVLAAEGYNEINLGGETPLDILAEAARTNEASLIWVAMNTPRPQNELARLTKQIERLSDELAGPDVHLVIGGNHVPEPLRRQQRANIYFGGSMSELAAFARGLHGSLAGK